MIYKKLDMKPSYAYKHLVYKRICPICGSNNVRCVGPSDGIFNGCRDCKHGWWDKNLTNNLSDEVIRKYSNKDLLIYLEIAKEVNEKRDKNREVAPTVKPSPPSKRNTKKNKGEDPRQLSLF